MRGPVTPDGVLALHPDDRGHAALFFSENQLTSEGVQRVLEDDPRLLLLGRSVLGQTGIDIQANGPPLLAEIRDAPPNVTEKGVLVPIAMQAYAPVGKALVEDVYNLIDKAEPGIPIKWEGQNLPFGRFADLSRLAKLGAEEVHRDIEGSMIYLDPPDSPSRETPPTYEIGDDGAISVKLSPLEFILNEDHLLELMERRLALLHRGRAGIARHSDHVDRKPDDQLPDFLLGGLVFSPGSHFWNVRSGVKAGKDISDNVRQLASAALFDGNRLMGVGKHLPTYDRHRQVELRSTGEQRPTFGETSVTIDLYRSTEIGESQQQATNWRRMTPEARRSRHIHGMTALEALDTADPASREALLEITRLPDIAALVLSRRGIQIINETGSGKFNVRNIGSALRLSADGIPSELKHSGLDRLISALGAAGDRTATVIAERLSIQDLKTLVDSGARAILSESFYGRSKGAINNNEHAILVDLSRSGIGIALAEDGDYREFHPSGLWVRAGVGARIDQVEMGFALFGGRREQIGQGLGPQIQGLFDGLKHDFGGAEKIAIIHGNGSGIMRVACVTARNQGILSLGFGIDVELLGQSKASKDADGYMNLSSQDWMVRQYFLEAYNTIPIFTIGGFGTLLEIYASIVDRKLRIGLPTPMIAVAPSHEFDETKRQIRKISNQGDIVVGTKAKKTVNISGDGLTPRNWIKNIMHFEKDFRGARRIIREFREDMPGYWRKAGIPPRHIEEAYENRRRQLDGLGMRLPASIERAVEEYIHGEGKELRSKAA